MKGGRHVPCLLCVCAAHRRGWQQNMEASPPNYKNLTTPQLKAALRTNGIAFEHVTDRAGYIELCKQHGGGKRCDVRAPRARIARPATAPAVARQRADAPGAGKPFWSAREARGAALGGAPIPPP